MNDGLINMYSFEMDGRHITLVPLTLKQIYNDQLKLKMTEKESLYIRETFFANKVLPDFGNDVIFLA
jgi:hypothetical protein